MQLISWYAFTGFLPEEWDKFFVKYLYPSFTPTVFLFVAGTVAYGVLKYQQNDQVKDQKWYLVNIDWYFQVLQGEICYIF